MSTTTQNLDITSMTEEQLALFVAEARRRKMDKLKSAKYAKFEPTYTDYRKAVVEAKKANDLKKSLLADLKKLGFGSKAAKANGTVVATPTANRGKGKGKAVLVK